MIFLESITFEIAVQRTAGVVIPPPPESCSGQLYTIQPGNSIFSIARSFGVTVEALLAANPQIANANVIYVGQVLCIPSAAPSGCNLRVLNLSFLTENGQPLPVVSGAVQLTARVILRGAFNMPVSKAFFFLEPTGTETCELARLIGMDCPSAVTGVAEVLWLVPAGSLGRVYMVACLDSCCAKSQEYLVVRNT